MKTYFSKRILPAITFEDAASAVQVANAVLRGGLDVMEVPFRTKVAAESIKLICEAFPEMKIGAGTILTPSQVAEAKKAGAQFGLAPGFNPAVVKEAIKIDFPFIPGVMTPSEVELALEFGCKILKLFPAAQVGGIAMLNALLGSYGHTGVKFIPMGGITIDNLHEFLSLLNVQAIGGSWLATKSMITEMAFDVIEQNVRTAVEKSRVINRCI
jgi:2-dehydro-3-deoxyphosphogluconate aldolase/(4S)-4-hydroxy-2-oxoglutarate aldolase